MATSDKTKVNSNPLIRAGWINKVFSWWLIDFVLYGGKHEIVAEDVYDTTPGDQSEPLRKSLETAWKNELQKARASKRKPRLWIAVARTYWYDFLKFSVFPVVSTTLMMIEPFLLKLMMSYFHPTSTMTQSRAYLNATAFISFMVLRSVVSRRGFFHFIRLGMRAKIACTSLIYKKMIRLSASSTRSSGGSVINLITADVAKFEIFFTFIPYLFIVPIQLLVTAYLIWQYVKLDATLASIAAMIVLTMPVLALYNKIFFKLRTKQSTRTDKRISLIGEVVNGIRAVKMYVWENYFEERVQLDRRQEIESYLRLSYITSAVSTLACFCHRVCVFIVILIYVPQHGGITADQILPVAQHFNNLQDGITTSLFSGVWRIADNRVAMKRIEDFLLLQEVDSSVERTSDGSTDELVTIENAAVSWDDQTHALKDIDLKFASKQLYAVVGAVGSGKSSLLKLILGEVGLVSGKVFVYGTISYASQEPWLFPGSLKNNILFGQPFDRERYPKVVSACALLDDFTNLPYADETLVGDRGMNLSGGQCARVNLARAVYRDADVYLFDNPLSAVDTRVAKKLMDECINNLLKDKTRILVTHNVGLLRVVDNVIFLNDGVVEFRGTVGNFKKNNHYLEHLPAGGSENLENELEKPNTEKSNVIVDSPDSKTGEPKETEELIAKGTVKMSVYSSYIKAGGVYRVLLIILLNGIFVTAAISFDYGLMKWIQNKDNSSLIDEKINDNVTMIIISEDTSMFTSSNQNVVLLLGSFILVIIIASIFINISFNVFILCASNNIHNRMFSRLMKTSLRFFETNTAGRILNRFSEDTRVAEDHLPKVLFQAMQPAFLVMPLLLCSVIINWWIIIPTGILILLLVLIGRMYVTTMQTLTRLAGIAKSPVLSFVASSIAGSTTIRACKAENFVTKDFDSRQDYHTAPYFLVQALFPATYLWVELINLGLLASTVYLCIVLKSDDTFEGFVGLTLMQIMNMTTNLSTMMVRLGQALSCMPNIERMLQFTELKQEDSISSESEIKLPTSWPDKGAIKFEKLYLRYSEESDPVLWDLSFTAVPGSKIGIVGRTGAGKSSLISALFRLAKIDGSVFIDDVDTGNVDLLKLRSKISIIPQDPFLFKATLRKNLDPNDEFEDALIWSALEDVELKESFDTLDSSIDLGGSNLSVGQRQLVCLARAIVRQNKILILDEATANIDLATDALIQKTIRSKFKQCTVLTIAHRLITIMDSDKVLVMDNGRVVEYDHPFLLLQNNDGHFSEMVMQSDNATAYQLKTIAEKAYKYQET